MPTDNTKTNCTNGQQNRDDDYPAKYTIDDFDLTVNMAGNGRVMGFLEPDFDEQISLVPPNGVYNGEVVLDCYYNGKPALYLYEPHTEEPVYVILLPTSSHEEIRTHKTPAGWNDLPEDLSPNE